MQAKSLSAQTRISGALQQFKEDTERLVIGKVRQIDETARMIIEDGKKLTGFEAPGRRFIPVVVVGGGYPITPSTLPYIKRRLADEGLLASKAIDGLCVVSPVDLAWLRGLHQQGSNPIEILRRWQASGLEGAPFRMFVSAQADLRERLDAEAAERGGPPAVLKDVMARLALPKRNPSD